MNNLDPREIAVWNAAIRAAEQVCRDVERAAVGQGVALGRARPGNGGRNPHAHRNGELRLGAARCLTGIADLRK